MRSLQNVLAAVPEKKKNPENLAARARARATRDDVLGSLSFFRDRLSFRWVHFNKVCNKNPGENPFNRLSSLSSFDWRNSQQPTRNKKCTEKKINKVQKSENKKIKKIENY